MAYNYGGVKMQYIKFELRANGDGTYTPVYKDADDGCTQKMIDDQKILNAASEHP